MIFGCTSPLQRFDIIILLQSVNLLLDKIQDHPSTTIINLKYKIEILIVVLALAMIT